MASKVYFTDFRTGLGTSLTVKLQKLIRQAGIGTIDFDNKFVAIKMHFGELGNLAYLRPNYAKAVADVVCKEMEDFQKRYKEILENKTYEKVLVEGAKKANEVANKTLNRVKKAVGLLSL